MASPGSLLATGALPRVLTRAGVLEAAFHLATVPNPDELRTGLSNFYLGLVRTIQVVWTRDRTAFNWACGPLTQLGELGLHQAQDQIWGSAHLTRWVPAVRFVQEDQSPLSDSFLFEATAMAHSHVRHLPSRAGERRAPIRLREDDEICCIFRLDDDAVFHRECGAALWVMNDRLSNDFAVRGPPFLSLLMAYRQLGWTPSAARGSLRRPAHAFTSAVSAQLRVALCAGTRPRPPTGVGFGRLPPVPVRPSQTACVATSWNATAASRICRGRPSTARWP
jgi:hypothetical protein